jgi:hypothetical protein
MLGKLFLGHRHPPDETVDIIARAFAEWKQSHPEGTMREFWQAVTAGEVVVATK